MSKSILQCPIRTLPLPAAVEKLPAESRARTVFFSLFDRAPAARDLSQAGDFLRGQLLLAENEESDLPATVNELEKWMFAGVENTGRQYQRYLAERALGGRRLYFPTRSHAFHFLRAVAPTKLVDGSWLFGILPHWQDARFLALVRTYIEELGEGQPSKNHVLIYKRLLASAGCARWDDLPDENYVQGAIQLSLAYQAPQFLPEIIGYNLGYEQLPLHLLITAHELKELAIDPYYFTLHLTVDNADCGHARQAIRAVRDAMPRIGDARVFWRRVRNGFHLNQLGANTPSVIASFEMDREMSAIFARKSVAGKYAHQTQSRIAGRAVNDWLGEPNEAGSMLATMEETGWFQRHRDPRESRFWKMIQGERAKMFGVFNASEQQLIWDWIAGDRAPEFTARADRAVALPQFSPDDKQQLRRSSPSHSNGTSPDDFDAETRALEAALAACTTPEERTAKLISLMGPALHHTAPGLLATRLFHEILG